MLNLFSPLIFHTGHKMDCLSITFGPTQLHICKSSHSFWQILVLRAPNWPQTAELKRKIDFPWFFFQPWGLPNKTLEKRGQKLAKICRRIDTKNCRHGGKGGSKPRNKCGRLLWRARKNRTCYNCAFIIA